MGGACARPGSRAERGPDDLLGSHSWVDQARRPQDSSQATQEAVLMPRSPNGSISKTPETKKLLFCGAINNEGNECRMPAGWGTQHQGTGRCKWHRGGSSGRKAAISQEASIFMGSPKDMNPIDAITWCIRITAGEVEGLSTQIALVDEVKWVEHTPLGKQMNVLVRARGEAQDRLVKYSKDAISLGLTARAIRLAEQFGATIARLLDGVAHDLGLTKAQQQVWPGIVRKHLILLEGAGVVNHEAND